MMTREELDALHGRMTPGEWFYGIAYEASRGPVPYDYVGPGYYENPGILSGERTVIGCDEYHVFGDNEHDAAGIVALKNAWPAQSARIAALEAEVGRLREALATIRDTFVRDNGRGYHSKDKTFAIEIADAALKGAGHE